MQTATGLHCLRTYLLTCYFAPEGVRSTVTSMSVLLSAHITRKLRGRASQNFCACRRGYRSSSDGIAIRYALPVLWMTSRFHIMALRRVTCIPKRRWNTTRITAEISTEFCLVTKTGSTHCDCAPGRSVPAVTAVSTSTV